MIVPKGAAEVKLPDVGTRWRLSCHSVADLRLSQGLVQPLWDSFSCLEGGLGAASSLALRSRLRWTRVAM